MSVVVHLKNGQQRELCLADSCSWSPTTTGDSARGQVPRWLICKNNRGEVVATFKEPEINGFQVTRSHPKRRFSFPRILDRAGV